MKLKVRIYLLPVSGLVMYIPIDEHTRLWAQYNYFQGFKGRDEFNVVYVNETFRVRFWWAKLSPSPKDKT